MEMDKPSVVTLELQTLVLSTLAESAIVQKLSHKETADMKDLDETTTAEEVAQAIISVIDAGIMTANIRPRVSYSGTQAASILLLITATKKLMKARKLRIGWLITGSST